MFIRRIKTEFQHFLKLPLNSQKLLLSYTFFNIAAPVFGIFINAYLWRQSSSLSLIGLYTLFLGVGLCIGFYINGHLLNKIKINTIYLAGCLLYGIIACVILFIPVITTNSVLIYGTISGIGAAFFWANRHFLSLSNTTHEQRFYFNSLEGSLSTITSVVIPFVVGWFIVLGERTGLYRIEDAYKIVSVLTLLVLFITGFVVKDLNVPVDKLQNIFLRNKSRRWNFLRVMIFCTGVSEGVLLFIPTLVILIFLGQEDILGTVQSLVALLSALVMYYIGRKVGSKNRFTVALFGVIMLIIGGLIFGIYYNALAAIIYVSLSTLNVPLSWAPFINLNFETIEYEEKIHHHHKYSYIFDQELFLNLGRIVTILIFLFCLREMSESIVLRYTPLIVAIVQIPMIIAFRKVEKG